MKRTFLLGVIDFIRFLVPLKRPCCPTADFLNLKCTMVELQCDLFTGLLVPLEQGTKQFLEKNIQAKGFQKKHPLVFSCLKKRRMPSLAELGLPLAMGQRRVMFS